MSISLYMPGVTYSLEAKKIFHLKYQRDGLHIPNLVGKENKIKANGYNIQHIRW